MKVVVLAIIGFFVGSSAAEYFSNPFRKPRTLVMNILTILLIIYNFIFLNRNIVILCIFLFIMSFFLMINIFMRQRISLKKFKENAYILDEKTSGYTKDEEYNDYTKFFDLAIAITYLDKKYGYSGFTRSMFNGSKIYEVDIIESFLKMTNDEMDIVNEIFNDSYLEIKNHKKFKEVFFNSISLLHIHYTQLMEKNYGKEKTNKKKIHKK